jgi:hypothetical protein
MKMVPKPQDWGGHGSNMCQSAIEETCLNLGKSHTHISVWDCLEWFRFYPVSSIHSYRYEVISVTDTRHSCSNLAMHSIVDVFPSDDFSNLCKAELGIVKCRVSVKEFPHFQFKYTLNGIC